MNNSQNRNFEEVQGGSTNAQWKPQATEKNGMVFDPNSPSNALEGYYIEERDVKGQQDRYFKVITFRTMNPDGSFGEDVDVIGDTVLVDRMSKIPMNSYCRVEYHGRLHKKGYATNMPWSQTNSYHNWKVFVDKNAVPFDQLMGKMQGSVQQPVQQQTNFNQAAQNHQQAPAFNPNQQQVQQTPVFNPAQQQVQQQPVFNPAQQQGQGTFTPQQPVQQQPVFNPAQQNTGGPNFQNNANRNAVGFNQANNVTGNPFTEDLPF